MILLKNDTSGKEQKNDIVTRSQTLLETNYFVASFAAPP
jgi:hypothetical protein